VQVYVQALRKFLQVHPPQYHTKEDIPVTERHFYELAKTNIAESTINTHVNAIKYYYENLMGTEPQYLNFLRPKKALQLSAYSKAVKLGCEEESEYLNNEKQKVKWSFEGLFDLDIIAALKDGAEISSKRFRADSSKGLVVSKEKLSVYFTTANNNKTANEILNDSRSE
jgi:hypothetical protein